MGRKKTGRPRGRPNKITTVPASEELHFRVSALQKADVTQASTSSGAGTVSVFIRDVVLQVSQGVQDLNTGRLKPEDFRRLFGEQIYNIISVNYSPVVKEEGEVKPGEDVKKSDT